MRIKIYLTLQELVNIKILVELLKQIVLEILAEISKPFILGGGMLYLKKLKNKLGHLTKLFGIGLPAIILGQLGSYIYVTQPHSEMTYITMYVLAFTANVVLWWASNFIAPDLPPDRLPNQRFRRTGRKPSPGHVSEHILRIDDITNIATWFENEQAVAAYKIGLEDIPDSIPIGLSERGWTHEEIDKTVGNVRQLREEIIDEFYKWRKEKFEKSKYKVEENCFVAVRDGNEHYITIKENGVDIVSWNKNIKKLSTLYVTHETFEMEKDILFHDYGFSEFEKSEADLEWKEWLKNELSKRQKNFEQLWIRKPHAIIRAYIAEWVKSQIEKDLPVGDNYSVAWYVVKSFGEDAPPCHTGGIDLNLAVIKKSDELMDYIYGELRERGEITFRINGNYGEFIQGGKQIDSRGIQYLKNRLFTSGRTNFEEILDIHVVVSHATPQEKDEMRKVWNQHLEKERKTKFQTDRKVLQDKVIVTTQDTDIEGILPKPLTEKDIANIINEKFNLDLNGDDIYIDEPIKEIGIYLIDIYVQDENDIKAKIRVDMKEDTTLHPHADKFDENMRTILDFEVLNEDVLWEWIHNRNQHTLENRKQDMWEMLNNTKKHERCLPVSVFYFSQVKSPGQCIIDNNVLLEQENLINFLKEQTRLQTIFQENLDEIIESKELTPDSLWEWFVSRRPEKTEDELCNANVSIEEYKTDNWKVLKEAGGDFVLPVYLFYWSQDITPARNVVTHGVLDEQESLVQFLKEKSKSRIETDIRRAGLTCKDFMFYTKKPIPPQLPETGKSVFLKCRSCKGRYKAFIPDGIVVEEFVCKHCIGNPDHHRIDGSYEDLKADFESYLREILAFDKNTLTPKNLYTWMHSRPNYKEPDDPIPDDEKEIVEFQPYYELTNINGEHEIIDSEPLRVFYWSQGISQAREDITPEVLDEQRSLINHLQELQCCKAQRYAIADSNFRVHEKELMEISDDAVGINYADNAVCERIIHIYESDDLLWNELLSSFTEELHNSQKRNAIRGYIEEMTIGSKAVNGLWISSGDIYYNSVMNLASLSLDIQTIAKALFRHPLDVLIELSNFGHGESRSAASEIKPDNTETVKTDSRTDRSTKRKIILIQEARSGELKLLLDTDSGITMGSFANPYDLLKHKFGEIIHKVENTIVDYFRKELNLSGEETEDVRQQYREIIRGAETIKDGLIPPPE